MLVVEIMIIATITYLPTKRVILILHNTNLKMDYAVSFNFPNRFSYWFVGRTKDLCIEKSIPL